jgi:hypothetical protein
MTATAGKVVYVHEKNSDPSDVNRFLQDLQNRYRYLYELEKRLKAVAGTRRNMSLAVIQAARYLSGPPAQQPREPCNLRIPLIHLLAVTVTQEGGVHVSRSCLVPSCRRRHGMYKRSLQ